MSNEQELSNLHNSGKLIELCSVTKNSELEIINKWYKKEEKQYIRPLKSGSNIDSSKILNASCIIGIRLSKDKKVTSTQLRRLLTGFQMVKEKTKTSGINASHFKVKT